MENCISIPRKMKAKLSLFKIFRITTPTGRIIGDNSCAYEALDVVCVSLMTSNGLIGWGYGETCSQGRFTKPAYWIRPMANVEQLQHIFGEHLWPLLEAKTLGEITENLEWHQKQVPSYLYAAVMQALWDLRAQEAEMPLWKFIGWSSASDQVEAYGSLLDFPVSLEQAIQQAENFVKSGFQSLKVKVGAVDIERDIERLLAIKAAVPSTVRLSADANIAWSANLTIRNLQRFSGEGIELRYIEDPLPCDDIDGFTMLAQAREQGEISTPVAAHDYVENVYQIERLLRTGGVNFIRNGKDISHAIEVAHLAREHGVSMIFGNSMFESNAHLACAFSENTALLEFSDLKWNDLMVNPIEFTHGKPVMPQCFGHGLRPKSKLLEAWRA